MKHLLRAPITLALLLTAFAVQAHEIEISDAWVRAAPPNAPALGAFMVINNPSDSERYLVAARTSLEVERVELHRTMMQDGVMQMVPHAKIPLAALSKTMLEPGSWHVMLIGPRSVPTEGETVALTLVFDDGSEQTIDAEVRKGKKMMHGHGQGHGQMQGHKGKHGCGQQKHKQMQAGKHKQGCGQGHMQGQKGKHDCEHMQVHGQMQGHEGEHSCAQGAMAN